MITEEITWEDFAGFDCAPESYVIVSFLDGENNFNSKSLLYSENKELVRSVLECAPDTPLYLPHPTGVHVIPPVVKMSGIFTVTVLSDKDRWMEQLVTYATSNGLTDNLKKLNERKLTLLYEKGISPEDAVNSV